MPRTSAVSAENNFNKGLKTEFTGLNFPENACTETFNCVFDRIGKVTRRKGFDYEPNLTSEQIDRQGRAISTFKWTNAGGDGNTQVFVLQVGSLLHFYRSSTATSSAPLSLQKLQSTVTLTSPTFSSGLAGDVGAEECQFAEGKGYLFVYHPLLKPFYCTYTSGVIVGVAIDVKIRDFEGIAEPGVGDTDRPLSLTTAHTYNLANQGWGKSYIAPATGTGTVPASSGVTSFTLDASTYPIRTGDRIQLYTSVVGSGPVSGTSGLNIYGTINNYIGNVIQITITGSTGTGTQNAWTLTSEPPSIRVWLRDIGNYPSNADIWWLYKNTSNIFDPKNTANNVTVNAGPAPKGFHILDAFNQSRSTVSGISGLTDLVATVMPTTGAWFQGRVWYSGVNSPLLTENIYFSQVVESVAQFGRCYQVNDPTSEERFDLLPTDGGIIRIEGCGSIHKLFAVQNGLMVFAANGIWFITGSQGIGFSANDYTITKLSSIKTISYSSFINVQGYPVWWNEEGIYMVVPSEKGGYSVNSLTDDSIASFFSEIPLHSKMVARGDYNPLTLTIQWAYRSTGETAVTAQYNFDRILNFNTGIGAFYPWSIALTGGLPNINGINYIEGSYGIDEPSISKFKYLTSVVSSGLSYTTFSEERNEDYTDWVTASLPTDYDSYFITGYKLHGEAQRKFQSMYVHLFIDSENSGEFFIRNIWNYATNVGTGKWSTPEKLTYNNFGADGLYSHRMKRIRLRGHGRVLQFRVESSPTKSFELVGWSVLESANKWV